MKRIKIIINKEVRNTTSFEEVWYKDLIGTVMEVYEEPEKNTGILRGLGDVYLLVDDSEYIRDGRGVYEKHCDIFMEQVQLNLFEEVNE